ncbi:MAG: hypothetical protein ICV69_14055 [Thermoleophilaceae bacterium]|nr:hypothetical protein [Thermoleophilaceae bacterium]
MLDAHAGSNLAGACPYAAWEFVLGVGTGILAEESNALPTAQQAVGAALVDSYGEHGLIDVLAQVDSVGWAVAMIVAAVALRHTHPPGWAASS